MQLRFYLFLAFILFTAFTIGLNLGLHGVLSLENVQIVMTKSGRDSVLSRSKTKEPPDTPQLADRNEKYTKRESFYEQDNREQKDARQNQGIDSLNKIDSSKNNSAASEDVAISPHISNPLLVDNKLDDELAKIDSIVQQRIAKDIESKQLNLIDTSNQILGNGGVIPIVLLTCNRAELLEQTLGSLLTVAGVSRENILVSQDGAIKTVADVVKKNNLQLIQNTEGLRLRGGVPIDGGKRIAKHYKFSLTAVFDRFPDAPAVIIVEDDLLFSPDFYEYFKLVAPVLYHDPSSFIVSAWSDNGFKGKVKDPYALRRTDYFPGLGWLLTRKLYKTELEAKWPGEHWDHWLRSPAIHQNREIVYPQV